MYVAGDYIGSRCACKVFLAGIIDGDLQMIASEVASLWNMSVNFDVHHFMVTS